MKYSRTENNKRGFARKAFEWQASSQAAYTGFAADCLDKAGTALQVVGVPLVISRGLSALFKVSHEGWAQVERSLDEGDNFRISALKVKDAALKEFRRNTAEIEHLLSLAGLTSPDASDHHENQRLTRPVSGRSGRLQT